MVHRLQDISKGLEEADYSLHCSSALKSTIETARNTEQKKKKRKVCTVVWGKRKKIRQRSKSLGGGGGVAPENFDGAVQHPIRDQYEIFPALYQT